MRALANDAPLVEHDDLVGGKDGRDALGDDDHGLAAQAGTKLMAKRGIGLVVERAETVVEEEDAPRRSQAHAR